MGFLHSTIWQQAACPAAPPPKTKRRGPLILIDYEEDDPTRGDSRGFRGIAGRIAERLGGRIVVTDFNSLREQHPDMKFATHKARLAEHFKDGFPEIIFSKTAGWDESFYRERGAQLIISNFNETLSTRYRIANDDLVSHPFTSEILKAEGQKFREHYPEISTPLIAVMLSDSYLRGLAESLADACRNYEEATIFICTSRRTQEYEYDELIKKLDEILEERNLSDRIEVLSYNLNRSRSERTANPEYNPYAGLIDQADHMLVCGTSGSLTSEPLAAGRTVHVYDTEPKPCLARKGLVKAFNSESERAEFSTERFKPVNPTNQIADAIIREYRFGRAASLLEPLVYIKSWLGS